MRARHTRGVIAAALAVGSVVAATGPSAPVQAASFTVNSTADAGDASPGDGICAAAGGACTLRAAVEESNSDSTTDHIKLPSGHYALSGSLPITNGVIDIRGAGSGVTVIDGSGRDRVFLIQKGALTLRNVQLTGGGNVGAGGAIYHESGGLQITDSLIKDNESVDAGGGAIYISEHQKFDIRKTEFDNNMAPGAFGGAIWNLGIGKIRDSLFVGNESNRAGAIHNNDVGQLWLRNVTVTDNTAFSPTGGTGGLHNNGFMFLNNVTITENTGFDRAGGIMTTSNAKTVMVNSIVADNNDTAGLNDDCHGDFSADSSHNLIGTTSTDCGLPASTATWVLNASPNLYSLANNGGPTRTHALPSNSAARDAGSPLPPGGPGSEACEEHDARGMYRLKCDMGAFELDDKSQKSKR